MPHLGELTSEWASAARGAFGERLPLALRFAELLASTAVEWGLLGPREPTRLWQRHLLNSAAVAALLPAQGTRSASIADIGSGAGLPGIVLALVRPDLQFSLVEPMKRRTDFLQECVNTLGLTNVEVIRARAEQLHGRCHYDVAVSRAVAPLPRLLEWCLPLVCDGGKLLAMKGQSAADELKASAEAVARWRVNEQRVEWVEPSYGGPGATVVVIGCPADLSAPRPDSRQRPRGAHG